MNKKLNIYIQLAKKITTEHPNPKTPCPPPDFPTHHAQMLQIFQHERLIHLIVTLFFAFLMVLFLALTITLFLILPSSSIWSSLLSYSSALITLILTITTIFYVRHYYRLENGVQQLESITANLFKK